MEPASLIPPAFPSSGRPKPAWAKRCVKSNPGHQPIEECVGAQTATINSGNFPPQSLLNSIQASVRVPASKEGASSGVGARCELAQVRFAFCDNLETCSLPVAHSNDRSSFDSEEATATQKNMEPSLPIPPAYPSTGRPKLSSKRISAGLSGVKQASVPGENECSSMCHVKTNMERAPPDESAKTDAVECGSLKRCSFLPPCAGDTLTYSDVDDVSATQAEIGTNAAGLRCTVCSKPPQLQSMNGCWKMISSVDAQSLDGTSQGVAKWLTRICIIHRKVRDGEGRHVSLKVCRGQRYLEGGRLYLDSNGVLHRRGKSGSHVCFRRDMHNCQLHLSPICEHDDWAGEEMDCSYEPNMNT